jgi:hypothetical protein
MNEPGTDAFEFRSFPRVRQLGLDMPIRAVAVMVGSITHAAAQRGNIVEQR